MLNRNAAIPKRPCDESTMRSKIGISCSLRFFTKKKLMTFKKVKSQREVLPILIILFWGVWQTPVIWMSSVFLLSTLYSLPKA